MKKWKDSINTCRWEIKLVIIALIFVTLMVCFVRTYERYVAPAANKTPEEFMVNNITSDYTRVSLDKGMVSQTIKGDYNGLSAFGIKFDVSNALVDTEKAKILVRFKDASTSKLIQESQIPVEQIVNENFQKILLNKELVGIVGCSYKIEVSLEGAKKVYLIISEEDTYSDGKCYQNEKLLKGDMSFSLFGSGYKFLQRVYYIVGLLFAFSVMLFVVYLAFWKNIKLENIFLIGSLLFGIIYSIVLPPFAIPDESAHFIAAYNVSSNILGKEAINEDERLQQDPYKNDGYFNRYTNLNTYRSVYNSFFDSEQDFLSFYDKQYNYIQSNSIYQGHFVSGFAITLGRLLQVGYMPIVYLARIFNLLFYCIVTYFAIKIIPIGKLFMLGVSFLPMLLEEAASVSYDGWIISFAFLYIAYCFHCVYVKEKVTIKDVVLLFVLLFLCSNFKYIYYIMGGLVLLIPKEKLCNKKQRYVLLGIFVAVFLVMAGNIVIERSQPKTVNQLEQAEENVVGGNRGQTYLLSDLLRHPKTAFVVYINTVRDKLGDYLEQMLGKSLGSLNVSVNQIYIYSLFLLLFIIALHSPKEKYIVSRNQGIILVTVFIGVGVAALLAMLVAWTNIDSDAIEGVQGRYFLPVLPLLGLLISKLPIQVEKDISRKLICIIIIINYFVVLNAFEYCIQLV